MDVLDVNSFILFCKNCAYIPTHETTTSRQLKEVQNRKIRNISSLFQRHSQTNRLDHKQAVLYIYIYIISILASCS